VLRRIDVESSDCAACSSTGLEKLAECDVDGTVRIRQGNTRFRRLGFFSRNRLPVVGDGVAPGSERTAGNRLTDAIAELEDDRSDRLAIIDNQIDARKHGSRAPHLRPFMSVEERWRDVERVLFRQRLEWIRNVLFRLSDRRLSDVGVRFRFLAHEKCARGHDDDEGCAPEDPRRPRDTVSGDRGANGCRTGGFRRSRVSVSHVRPQLRCRNAPGQGLLIT